MEEETRLVDKADCSHEIKMPLLFQKKKGIIVDPWFQRLLWFETGWGR